MTTTMSIWPVAADSATDADRAIATVTTAFAGDPVLRWVFPTAHEYLSYFPKVVGTFAGGSFKAGTAHVADDFCGAALWLPPGTNPDEEAVGGLFQEAIPEARSGEVFGFLEQMGQFHPTDSHWYLPFIGVDPARQGQGAGSALLRHALAECDRQKLPAYLEASSPRNKPLYERHGFEAIGVIQAGGSPPMWPMLRKPR